MLATNPDRKMPVQKVSTPNTIIHFLRRKSLAKPANNTVIPYVNANAVITAPIFAELPSPKYSFICGRIDGYICLDPW